MFRIGIVLESETGYGIHHAHGTSHVFLQASDEDEDVGVHPHTAPGGSGLAGDPGGIEATVMLLERGSLPSEQKRFVQSTRVAWQSIGKPRQ